MAEHGRTVGAAAQYAPEAVAASFARLTAAACTSAFLATAAAMVSMLSTCIMEEGLGSVPRCHRYMWAEGSIGGTAGEEHAVLRRVVGTEQGVFAEERRRTSSWSILRPGGSMAAAARPLSPLRVCCSLVGVPALYRLGVLPAADE